MERTLLFLRGGGNVGLKTLHVRYLAFYSLFVRGVGSGVRCAAVRRMVR